MMQQGQVFVEMIRKLLQHLLEYRSIIRDEVKEHRMSCIVNLLVISNFIHDYFSMYLNLLVQVKSLKFFSFPNDTCIRKMRSKNVWFQFTLTMLLTWTKSFLKTFV